MKRSSISPAPPNNTEWPRPKAHDCNRFAPELIRIGYVTRAHGVGGAIRIKLENRDSVILRSLERLTFVLGGEQTEYSVSSSQPASRGTFKVTLQGIASAADAAAMRGAIVMVEPTALPPTTGREFYYFQALGCEVITSAGLALGTIEEVFSTGANDVWVVRDRSAEHLLPVIEDVVKDIDWVGRRVIIEAVPGLLD